MSSRRPDLTPSIVERLRAGSNAAGSLMEEMYRVPLVRFAWGYLRSRDDAEDAVQEVFCKVLAAREVPSNFRAWIYRITRNHCLNLIRGRSRRHDVHGLNSWEDLADSLTGNLTRLEKEEERERLARALATLTESHQEVLRLRYTEGLSRQEISDVLDLPVATVKSRLFEGLKKLRLGTDLEGK